MSSRIFVVGYHNHGNAGDDAMTEGLTDELSRRKVEFKIMNGKLSEDLKGIWQSDIVMLAGGTHLRNWGKGWFIQGLRILCLAIFCRMLGKQFHMVNVGIDGKIWEWLARRVSNFVSIRDIETFDSAVLMDYPKPQGLLPHKVLGVNLTPVNTIYFGNREADERLADEVGLALREWHKKHLDWSIEFFDLNNNSKYSDHWINLRASSHVRAKVREYHHVKQTLYEMSRCGAFIGMRYHACVFAYMLGVPQIVVETYTSCLLFAFCSHLFIVPSNVVHLGNIDILMGYLLSEWSLLDSKPISEAKELARKGISV